MAEHFVDLKDSNSMKFTIKLGRPGRSIAELLKKRHTLAGPVNNWGSIVGAELYYGQAYESMPPWKGFIEEGAGELLPALTNQGAAALLFIPVGNQYLIYIFGYGFLSINDGFTEWDFGLKVVLNSIDSNGIKSLDSHTINQKAKNKRVQVATQAGIDEFDVDILQDLVSQISGKAVDASFAKTLTGGSSLSMTVDMQGTSVVRKSSQIMHRYAATSYQTNFKWIDFIAPEKDPLIIDALNLSLESALSDLVAHNGNHEFVLSYPSIVELENLDYITFGGFESTQEFDVITISDWVAEYRSSGYQQLAHNPTAISLDLHDGHGKVFKSFPFYRCLTTEIDYQGAVYILTSGTWFKLDADHYETVSRFFIQLSNSNEFKSGEQTNETTEEGYLKNSLRAGDELLDRKLYNNHGVKNTLEYGDIINDQAEVIHVKDGGSSAKLSHLFNQGTVSARLLLTDKTFRSGFRSKITNTTTKALFPLAAVVPANTTIVFRILKKGPEFTLPFFSKIILYDTYQKIKRMGYNFRLDWVEYV
ncbi:DUF6119 family protein [Mucilaginibacter angelicae]|uniref:DUF6119 family protein n=1 Tax=Mucilaginibacter angelicae TaxID=869718 RepID=A0ABV6L589_9SPHI